MTENVIETRSEDFSGHHEDMLQLESDPVLDSDKTQALLGKLFITFCQKIIYLFSVAARDFCSNYP